MIEFPCGLAGEIHITRADIDAIGGERKMRDALHQAISDKGVVEGTAIVVEIKGEFGGVTVSWWPEFNLMKDNRFKTIVRI